MTHPKISRACHTVNTFLADKIKLSKAFAMFSGPNFRLVNTWLQYSMVNTCVPHGMVTEIKVDSAW